MGSSELNHTSASLGDGSLPGPKGSAGDRAAVGGMQQDLTCSEETSRVYLGVFCDLMGRGDHEVCAKQSWLLLMSESLQRDTKELKKLKGKNK